MFKKDVAGTSHVEINWVVSRMIAIGCRRLYCIWQFLVSLLELDGRTCFAQRCVLKSPLPVGAWVFGAHVPFVEMFWRLPPAQGCFLWRFACLEVVLCCGSILFMLLRAVGCWCSWVPCPPLRFLKCYWLGVPCSLFLAWWSFFNVRLLRSLYSICLCRIDMLYIFHSILKQSSLWLGQNSLMIFLW